MIVCRLGFILGVLVAAGPDLGAGATLIGRGYGPQSPGATLLERLEFARRLAQNNDARAADNLSLLAYDPDFEVRMVALSSALNRCAQDAPSTCIKTLQYFAEEQEAPGAWHGRSALIGAADVADPLGILASSKMELVARLTALLDQPAAPATVRRALRLLAEDEDAGVQEAASAALSALDR